MHVTLDAPSIPKRTILDDAGDFPIPPAKDGFSTIMIGQAMTPAQFKTFISKDKVMTFRASIVYWDAYGTRYETTICQQNLYNGATMFCPTGNSMK